MTDNLKIAVLIPDRCDRQQFTAHARYLILQQTVRTDEICFMDYEPESNDIDITQRYKRGFEQLKDKADVILFMENDDWYSENYIETMLREWDKAGKPELFGIGNTTYYHIFTNQYFTINHPKRASMMSTMISTNARPVFPRDNNPYLDMELWTQLQGKTFIPPQPICIGIKHGLGLVGGGCHNSDSGHYNKVDANNEWLYSIIDSESKEFYKRLKES